MGDSPFDAMNDETSLGFDDVPAKVSTFDNNGSGSAYIGARYNGGYFPPKYLDAEIKREAYQRQLHNTKQQQTHTPVGMAAMQMGNVGRPYAEIRANPRLRSSRDMGMENFKA
jgi:hypothetical protein